MSKFLILCFLSMLVSSTALLTGCQVSTGQSKVFCQPKRQSFTMLHAKESAELSTEPSFEEMSFAAMKKAEENPDKTSVDVFTDTLVDTLKGGINVLYGDRHFARFYALETIARVPYFSYLSVLHLYETLGRWRNVNILKLHFAESWNELHHLLIMEELGGDDNLVDRLFAVHAAFFYYFIVVAIYMIKPDLAYNLNKKVEQHAWKTYATFVDENEEMLKGMPVPGIAKKYYCEDELFLEDVTESRKPIILNTLYDVFVNIRDDEAEHALSMDECEQAAAADYEALGMIQT